VPIIAGCGSNDTMNAHLHMTFPAQERRGGCALRRARTTTGQARQGCSHISYLASTVDLPIILTTCRAAP